MHLDAAIQHLGAFIVCLDNYQENSFQPAMLNSID